MSEEEKPRRFRSLPCNLGCVPWCRKYFWEGQLLEREIDFEDDETPPKETWYFRFIKNNRRLVAMAIPAFFFHFIWWGLAIRNSFWHLFKEKYFMSITMAFGSIIAGMTSEGGSSVAFPVMTLAFNIEPYVARDFSFIIQSCGMSCAAFSILFMKVQLEWHAIVLGSFGGVIGTLMGLEYIDPLLTPEMKKMGFVSIWFSFAFSLLLLNLYHKRKTYNTIPQFGLGKMCILILTGIIGGIFTSVAGSGLDICTFSMLTLLFRVSEKVATPTSVVLMAGNTMIGSYWKIFMMSPSVTTEAWEFVAVCVPLVVIGAPLGSVLGSHFHRHVLASFVYISDTVALVSALCLVKQTKVTIIMTVSIVLGGFIFFFAITKVGEWLMKNIEKKRHHTSNNGLEATEEAYNLLRTVEPMCKRFYI